MRSLTPESASPVRQVVGRSIKQHGFLVSAGPTRMNVDYAFFL